MASTPPKVSGSPESEAHRRWVEEQIRDLQGKSSVTQKRVEGVAKQATIGGNVAADAANHASTAIDRTVGQDSTNRLARPIADATFWQGVTSGATQVWTLPGVDSSTSRNVTWSAGGGFTFQPNADTEGAEIDITPILPIPASRKLYVDSGPQSAGLSPEIHIIWRDVDGIALEEPAPTVVTSASVIDAPIPVGTYSVRLVRPAGSGLGQAADPRVFEGIGKDGLAVTPGGISVEDENGEKTVEINPSLPILDPPSAPSLTSSVGSVSVRWDGLLSSGPAPARLAYVYAEQSLSAAGPWTRIGQPLNLANQEILTRPPVGATRWFRLTAMDTSNRPSPPGPAASIVVEGVKIPDVGADIVDSITSAQDAADAAAGAAAEALEQANQAIVTTLAEYVVTDSATTPPPPTAGWSTDTPDWGPGEYVWRRFKNTRADSTVMYTAPEMITGPDGVAGEDAVLLRVSSTRGTSFKNNAISTVLTVTVFKGSEQITNIIDLRDAFGVGAYIEWLWRRMDDEEFGVISSSDPRLSEAGFALTVSPADVDGQTVFQAILNT